MTSHIEFQFNPVDEKLERDPRQRDIVLFSRTVFWSWTTSQADANGCPTYRLNTAGLVLLHNRFRGCILDTRAEFPAAFSDELMALEVYVTWRGTGLSVKTPAVRQ